MVYGLKEDKAQVKNMVRPNTMNRDTGHWLFSELSQISATLFNN